MSAIPPNWLGSIIQAHGAQQRAGQTRAGEDAAAAERNRDAGAADNRNNTIENDDTDSSVYSDAEGAGSQGRSTSEPPEDELTEQMEDDDRPVARRLDVQG